MSKGLDNYIDNSELIKVCLIRNNPSNYFPPCIPPTLTQGKNEPYNRIGKIIDQIDYFGSQNRLYVDNDEKVNAVWDKIRETPNTIFTVMGFDNYYFWYNPIDKRISECKIKEFWTNRYWEIVRADDDYEFIRFYDESTEDFVVVDNVLKYVDGEDKLGVEKHKSFVAPRDI